MKIKKQFQTESENVKKYSQQIKNLEGKLKSLDKIKHQPRIRRELERAIKELKHKVNTMDNIDFYVASTAGILHKYKKMLNTPIKMSFMGKSNIDNTEKINIINEYVDIAKRYINIIDRPMKDKIIICNNCDVKDSFDIIDNSIYICINCGSQQKISHHVSKYKDIDRINISTKYTYARKSNFKDCIDQYQGKQNCNINEMVYDMLVDRLVKHRLVVGDDSTPKGIRFSKVTKNHIHKFLKELGYAKHYENVNLIYYNITGKRPDDITYLEPRLLRDFDILTECYDMKFKNDKKFKRKNFINTHYVLYQLLCKNGHKCDQNDFTMLKTVDRKKFHDDIAKKCFEELSWNHTPLI